MVRQKPAQTNPKCSFKEMKKRNITGNEGNRIFLKQRDEIK